MNNGRKLLLERTLMVLSIVLLLVLEVYWLNNELKEQYRRLRRDTAVNLRVTAMQEQFKKYINAKGNIDLQFNNSAVKGNFDIKTDSIEKLLKGSETNGKGIFGDSLKSAKINVVIATDSGDAPPPPRLFMFDQERQQQDADDYTKLVATFPVSKHVSLPEIEKKYRESLHEAGIDLAFTLKKIAADSTSKEPVDGGQAKALRLEKTDKDNGSHMRRFDFRSAYLQATFENPFWFLIAKIRWQLFFGFVMLAVTATAFVFLYRSLLQQQRLAAIKSDLISNITHELKTPIATVSVAIEALKNFDAIKDAAKTKNYLDISSGELQRLNLLVDRVLKLSLFEQQQINLQIEQVDMQQLLSEVLNTMKLQFEKHAAVVDINIKDAGFTIMGDRMHLVGVFYNLLDNALKYSPESPVINIVLEKNDTEVRVTIADNGIGIPAAYHKKVFEKFFRVPHGDTHNIKGYGLGLSYVQAVVKRHGGHIGVKANGQKGSAFTVSIPFEATASKLQGALN